MSAPIRIPAPASFSLTTYHSSLALKSSFAYRSTNANLMTIEFDVTRAKSPLFRLPLILVPSSQFLGNVGEEGEEKSKKLNRFSLLNVFPIPLDITLTGQDFKLFKLHPDLPPQ